MIIVVFEAMCSLRTCRNPANDGWAWPKAWTVTVPHREWAMGRTTGGVDAAFLPGQYNPSMRPFGDTPLGVTQTVSGGMIADRLWEVVGWPSPWRPVCLS
jgi:hypothetical protein